MKKWMWVFTAACLMSTFGYAAETSIKERVPTQTKEEAEAELKKRNEERKRVAEARKNINDTRWDVAVTSNNPKIKPFNDVLTISRKQISLESLSKKGFTPTNYTLTFQGDVAVWETMQRGKTSDDIAFIRCEVTQDDKGADQARGTVSERLEKGKVSTDYYFTSTSKVKIEADDAAKTDENAKAQAEQSTPIEKAKVALEAKSESKDSKKKK